MTRSITVAALVLAACGPSPAERSRQPRRDAAASVAQQQVGGRTMERDWASGACDRAEPMPAYVGQDLQAAADALGAATGEEKFRLGDGMNEFRIELRNDLPLPANAATPVLERTWAAGDCRLTLWSVERGGRWQVVRALRWPAGAQF